MIELVYNGGLGNQMFQYCFARMTAQEMGLKLRAKPLADFPNTNEPVFGQEIEKPEIKLTCTKENPLNYASVLKHKNEKIILDGFFQNFNQYPFNKEQITKWFELPDYNRKYKIYSNDLVIHLRLGDYTYHGLSLTYDYYKQILAQTTFDKLYIVTNQPNDQFLKNFKTDYEPIIISHKEHIKDLQFITKFSKIIGSASTFSWWSAYLAPSLKEFYWPMPIRGIEDNYLMGLRLDKPEFKTVYNCVEWRRQKLNGISFLLEKLGLIKNEPIISTDNKRKIPNQVLSFHENSEYIILK